MRTFEIDVNLIGLTTTETGLKVYAELNPGIYEMGKKVSDEDFSQINIAPSRFHGAWNYVIRTLHEELFFKRSFTRDSLLRCC